MNRDKEEICGECRWCDKDQIGDYVCCNADSEYVTDWVGYNSSCDDWEAKGGDGEC